MNWQIRLFQAKYVPTTEFCRLVQNSGFTGPNRWKLWPYSKPAEIIPDEIYPTFRSLQEFGRLLLEAKGAEPLWVRGIFTGLLSISRL